MQSDYTFIVALLGNKANVNRFCSLRSRGERERVELLNSWIIVQHVNNSLSVGEENLSLTSHFDFG